MAQIRELDRLKIPLQDVIQATNNFAKETFIGIGGFGRVYKGQLPNSTKSGEPTMTVAIKRLDNTIAGQGQREFVMEIVMLASYKHRNLVSLVGFCDDGDEIILVYKYEDNGSLDNHLASTNLTWVQRLQICLGAARGLEYLHGGVGPSHRVIHRDIKSSNILLDENWEAKISDFGLSKIGPKNQEFTFLVSNVAGTFGYVDPQYHKTGELSKESDVYSFGVVLFEVLCGTLAMNAEYHDERRFLANIVKRRYKEGKLREIIMANLREQMKPYSLQTFSRVAHACLKESRNERPLMREVVQELQSSLEYQIGSPTTLWGSSKGGYPWSLLLENNMKLRKIKIDYKDWIFSIEFTLEDLKGSFISCRYGGNFGGNYGRPSGGQVSEMSLDADEDIIEIRGTVGVSTGYDPSVTVISSLYIVTNKRQHRHFGKATGTNFSVSWNVGSFAGFYGRAGAYMDALGFYSKNAIQTFSHVAHAHSKESQNERPLMSEVVQELPSALEHQIGSPTTLWGSSTGGYPWSLLLENNMKLRKIKIDYKDWIFSIDFTLEDSKGSLNSCRYGGNFGGNYDRPSGSQVSEMSLDADEDIIEIRGTVGVSTGYYPSVIVISSLYIVTNKRKHKHFGKDTGTSFSVSWDAGSFAGFYGRAGAYMDALGFYSKNAIMKY